MTILIVEQGKADLLSPEERGDPSVPIFEVPKESPLLRPLEKIRENNPNALAVRMEAKSFGPNGEIIWM